jgi:HlyD family secretion protein
MERTTYSLGQLVLHAPIGGLVVYKKNWRGTAVAVGDTLWPGNVVMSIVDPASTALDAFVLEKDAAGVEVGAAATVMADARPDRRFEGKVTMIADVSRPIERGSPVKYTAVQIELLDGDPTLLKPGMKGDAYIRTGRIENAVVVPRAAIRGDGDAPYVLVAADSGVERRSVKLGSGDLARVGVSEGLSEGERVLVGEAPAVAEPLAKTDASARAGT